jgi:hypothetical protein
MPQNRPMPEKKVGYQCTQSSHSHLVIAQILGWRARWGRGESSCIYKKKQKSGCGKNITCQTLASQTSKYFLPELKAVGFCWFLDSKKCTKKLKWASF